MMLQRDGSRVLIDSLLKANEGGQVHARQLPTQALRCVQPPTVGFTRCVQVC
jgi:hypothetical protein